MGWGDGKAYERQASQNKDYGGAMSSRFLNPKQKQLDRSQAEALKAIVAKHAALVAEAAVAEADLRTDAYLRAIESGQVHSVTVPVAKNPLDPWESGEARKQTEALHNRMQEDLVARLGKVGHGFIFTMMSSTEPDGVPRSNFIVVERSKESRYFDALDTMKRRVVERDRELTLFFHGLPE